MASTSTSPELSDQRHGLLLAPGIGDLAEERLELHLQAERLGHRRNRIHAATDVGRHHAANLEAGEAAHQLVGLGDAALVERPLAVVPFPGGRAAGRSVTDEQHGARRRDAAGEALEDLAVGVRVSCADASASESQCSSSTSRVAEKAPSSACIAHHRITFWRGPPDVDLS